MQPCVVNPQVTMMVEQNFKFQGDYSTIPKVICQMHFLVCEICSRAQTAAQSMQATQEDSLFDTLFNILRDTCHICTLL